MFPRRLTSTLTGTPLDILFEFSETPDEARAFGAELLELLATRGQYVVAYVKREMFLHSSQSLMTYTTTSSFNNHPQALRHLQYIFDEANYSVQ